MRLKGQYNADLTLSPRLHVKRLITAIRAIPFITLLLMIQWKLNCQSRKQKPKNQPITRFRIKHCDWFILPFSACDSDNAVFTGAQVLALLPTLSV